MSKYKVTFTASFVGFVEADDGDDAAAAVYIPEHPELDAVPEGVRTSYVADSCEVLQVEEIKEEKSPCALRTNPGDRFVIRAADLDWRDSDGGWDAQGIQTPDGMDEDALVLVTVGELRDDEFWNCYIVPEKEAGNLWPSQGLWAEEGDREATILTDGEVQTAIANSINMLRRSFIESQEKK